MNKYFRSGILGEYIAILLYLMRFYKILFHRWDSYVGEIDIIAVRWKVLVFIEVKTRKCGISDKIISPRQKQRIQRAAELFVSINPYYKNHDLRFDLVMISPYALPKVITNAW